MCPKVVQKPLKMSTFSHFVLPFRSPGSLIKKRQNLSAQKSENNPKRQAKRPPPPDPFFKKIASECPGGPRPPSGRPLDLSNYDLLWFWAPKRPPKLLKFRQSTETTYNCETSNKQNAESSSLCFLLFLGGPVGRVPAIFPEKKAKHQKRNASAPPGIYYFLGGVPVGRVPASRP